MDNIWREFHLDKSYVTEFMDSKDRQDEFSERFNEACKKTGHDKMTQIELGEILGVSGPVINRYRNGKRLPAITTAIKMSELLGVSLDWLMTGRGSLGDSFSLEEVWMSYPEEDRINFLANLANRHRK